MKAQNYVIFLKRLSSGRLKLWQAFWLVFVPIPIVLYAIYALFLFLLEHFTGSVITFTQLTAVAVLYSTIAIALLIVLGMGVWRCALNTPRVLWGYIARIAVTSYLIWYGIKVITGWLVLINLAHVV